MDLYSTALALALVAAGVAALAAVASWLAAYRRQPETAAVRRRWARGAAPASLTLAALSFGYHLLTGHRPGTPEAMGPVELLLEHPALVLVAAGAGLLLLLTRPAKQPRARAGREPSTQTSSSSPCRRRSSTSSARSARSRSGSTR